MRWMLKQSTDAEQHIASADNPNLRLFDLTAAIYPNGKVYDLDLLRNTNEHNYYATQRWQPCTPDSSAWTFCAKW